MNHEIHCNNNGTGESEDYQSFISLHSKQLETSQIPAIYWPTIVHKIENGVFDAGEVFSIIQVEYEDDIDGKADWKVIVTFKENITPDNGESIYLIDHAWTYEAHKAEEMLEEIPELATRMQALFEVGELPKEELFPELVKRMWKFNQTYSYGGVNLEAEDSIPIWYILDEFGSRIQHSSEPSFRIVPFLYLPTGMSFSLLYPLKEMKWGEEVTRNYIEGPDTDPLIKSILLNAWDPVDLSATVDPNQKETEEAFSYGGRDEEEDLPAQLVDPLEIQRELAFRIYSQYEIINEHLTHPAFELTASIEDADILWLTDHFKNFRQLSRLCPNKFINQFPFEHVITNKDLLAIVCRRVVPENSLTVNPSTLTTAPSFLPTTYNLNTELAQFVAYFQLREKKNLDNHWIVKPWNLARSLDISVTNNLDQIISLRSTGPKIVCKYIDQPVLYTRETIGPVKFDIRYIILVRSYAPLKAFVYSKFWLRFANKQFSLDNLCDYEQHFTVMNYNTAPLQQMFCDDFIKNFEEQYPSHKWKEVEEGILQMLRQTLEASVKKEPPMGVFQNPQSRAMYAVDLMLQWDQEIMQPQILEINWCPDCQRACDYYPSFFNDVFSTLFLDKPVNVIEI